MKTIAAFLFSAAMALAAGIDGTWVAERDMPQGKIVQTFELKADGDKLTGKMTTKFGDMEARTSEIQNGKIDGDKHSFTVTLSMPQGDFTIAYNVTVDGDTMKGTAGREGGQGRPFEAKRQ